MKLPSISLNVLPLCALLVAGCASSTSKRVDEKLAEQPAIASHTELQNEAQRRIESDPTLTEDQKKRLSILRTKLSAEMDGITSESLKLRSVLVEEILSPSYSIDEVGLIKKRLKKLEDRRLSVMFDGVDQANSILGREAPKHSRVMRDLLENRASRN